jgi:hypothetical protein
MKLPSKAKEIKRTETEKFGSALLDLLFFYLSRQFDIVSGSIRSGVYFK